ncbi:hypothetical protein SLEP1_g29362 [Rubroshorea leprosula]|uniref:RING-type domain-containing protein n=1 Tax=Rubroshorea leprosula TaxID=152421 RepID=A0AAV5JZ67_9ROSI|nr:hypothetical protein SLEP1_g29362 [Rubroshorea leprosula]
MGQQQSKDELVYQQVNYGNIEGIKALRREGAGLEWIDRDGKTPLILACMNPELYNVAKTLIELGANVNAYRPGRQAGTPLHHAAKRGLENTVKLLLSHGANPLLVNDDCQTALDVARAKGFSNVVRAIENHICLFSGWMREFYGPGFLEALAPQLLSRKVWVVIVPTGSRNMSKPFKLELAIYTSLQDAQPRTVIALWKVNLEEPKPNQPVPSVVLLENSTISRGRRRRRVRCSPRKIRRYFDNETHIKLAPAIENDWRQLQWFCDACKGITQAMHPAFQQNSQPPSVQVTEPPSDVEDLELAMALSASIHSAISETTPFDVHSSSKASTSTSRYNGPGASVASVPAKASSSDWTAPEAGSSGSSTQATLVHSNDIPVVPATNQTSVITPSAPPIADEIIEDGPIHYPSIDTSSIDLTSPTDSTSPRKEEGSTQSCVVCLDAPSEAACVPCGHVAGCMSCLNDIKAKKWGCPVCRTKIEQVIKIYHV